MPGRALAIDADNVVDITLRQAYIAFDGQDERRELFLGDIARATWDAFSSRDLGSPATVIKALAVATRTKHLTLWFADPVEQRLAERARADGAVPREVTDIVLLTTGNASENKIDYFLERTVHYDIAVVPSEDAETVGVRGTVGTTLENHAPSSGLPTYIIGPNDERFAAGENYSYVTLYSDLDLVNVTLDGQPFAVEAARELGHWAYANYLSLQSMTSHTLELTVEGKRRLRGDGWFELALESQPGVTPDHVDISLTLPEGWRFAESEGLELVDDGRRATMRGDVEGDRLLRVRIERDYGGDLWGRLQAGE